MSEVELNKEELAREWNAHELAAIAEKNPAATDWMLRISEQQDGLVVTHELLEQILDGFSWIGQLEQGSKTDYRHWQIFVQSTARKRFSSLRKLFEKRNGVHLGYCRPRQGTVSQCVAYVTKQATRIDGPYSAGQIQMKDGQGKRTDLQELSSMVLSGEKTVSELLLDPELSPRLSRSLGYFKALEAEVKRKRATAAVREVKTLYLWGAAGSGKSRWVEETYGRSAYKVTDYRNPWDSYSGQSVLVLEEYSPNKLGSERHCLLLEELFSVLDPYPMELHARYENNWAEWDTVIVISNLPLSEQYPGMNERQRPALNRRFGAVFEKQTWADEVPMPCVPTPPAAVQSSAADVDDEDDEF